MCLRRAASEAMDGRRWTDLAISMKVCLFAPCLEKGKTILDYVSGIMDTLDGSHGPHFTYLPIVYQDDCQVSKLESRCTKAKNAYYIVDIHFIE
jgi:hypothetical protein